VTADDLGQLIATSCGEKAIADYVVAGGDVNAIEPRSNWPLLHLACEHRNFEAIRALIKAGANLEAIDKFGQTALHIAVDNDIDSVAQLGGQLKDMRFETTRLLIELGAKTTARDNQGQTPRDIAVTYGMLVRDQFDRLTHS